MRRKTVVILALVLVFALMFTACAARRPLQNPVQPRGSTTGNYDNNRGIANGTGTGVGTRTGIGDNYYTGNGPSASDPYDLGFGAGNNAGNNRTGFGNTTGNPNYFGGYDNGLSRDYGADYRNIGGGNNSANFGLNNTARTNQNNEIERAIEQISGIRDATVVVSGNTAYVGLDTGRGAAGQNVAYGNDTGTSALKQTCAQRVRAANPEVRTVYVSTEAGFIDRLRRVGDGMRIGNPDNRFRNELDELVRNLTPER